MPQWQVQLVRCRGYFRKRMRGLRALRWDGLVVVVDKRKLEIRFNPKEPLVWWTTSPPQQVLVKKRLVKLVTVNHQAIILRMRCDEDVLSFALAARSAWRIETQFIEAKVTNNNCCMEEQPAIMQLAELYMTSPTFRSQVQNIHELFQTLNDC